LDWHKYPTHFDLGGLVRHTGTANRFVAASSSITQWVEGSKGKAGKPAVKIRNSKFDSPCPVSFRKSETSTNDQERE
jgi:hypothetical protein